MKNIILRILSVLYPITIIGCASLSPLDQKVLNSIQSISVDREVKILGQVQFSTTETRMLASGLVGGVIEKSVNPEPARIEAYLKQENINVGEIVRTEFLSALQKDPRFSNKLAENGEARFVLTIGTYGLINKPFSKELQAKIMIMATLLNSKGEVLSRNVKSIIRHDNVPALPYEAYFESPNTFRSSFKLAASTVIQMLLADERPGQDSEL